MKSKEALELLKQRIIVGKGKEDFDLLYKKYYDVIKKDLEVLEIIKNKLVFLLAIMYLSYETYNALMDEKQNLTQEEYNKLKEWLEDETI